MIVTGERDVQPLRRTRRDLARVGWLLAAYAAIRMLGLLVLHAGVHADQPLPENAFDPSEPPQPSTFEKLGAWDGGWYVKIADHGYPDHLSLSSPREDETAPLVFPPLYPMAMRLLHLLGMPSLSAGLLITALAGAVAVVGVYAVARELISPRAAMLAALLWAAGPMTVVLSMVYSEALFVALAAWSIWAVRRGWWLTAGVLGLLSGLTRSTGLAVAAAIAVAALLAWPRAGSRANPAAQPGADPTAEEAATPQAGAGLSGGKVTAGADPAAATAAPSRAGAGSAGGKVTAGADSGAQTAASSRAGAGSAGGAATAPSRARIVAGVVLAGLGVPMWWAYVAIVSGRIDGWFAAQELFWGSRFDFGASVLRNAWRTLTFDGLLDPAARVVQAASFLAMLTALLLLAALLAHAWRTRAEPDRAWRTRAEPDRAWRTRAEPACAWWPVAAYALVLVVLAAGSAGYDASKVRFLVPMFALLLLPARRLATAGRTAQIGSVVVAALASAWFGAFMLTVWPYAI